MAERADLWLDELAGLWQREREAARARSAEVRRGLTLAERARRGVALADLELDDIGGAPGNRLLVWLAPAGRASGAAGAAGGAGAASASASASAAGLADLRVGPGDPVRLWRSAPDQPDAIRGVVARRQQNRIGVIIDGELPALLEDGRVHLDVNDSEATFDRGARAIARTRAAAASSPLGAMRAVLAGEVAPAFEPTPGALVLFDGALEDPAQRAAVEQALAARELALIHGPPGTGKTRVLVEVVRQLVARDQRVLIAAASNAAVDHLAGQLVAAGLPLVRLGHPARVDPALEHATLDAHLERDGATDLARGWLDRARELRRRARARRSRSADRRALRELTDEARALERDARQALAVAEEAVIARARIVAATCAGADAAVLQRGSARANADAPAARAGTGPPGSSGRAVDHVAEVRFDTVIIDEATQALDPIALCAMARAGRVIMAGDPCQLPPTVIDPEAARAGLRVTAFERLAAGASLLVTQHRMHRAIMAFPSASMYRGALVAAPAVAGHTLEDLGVRPDPLRPGPLVFIDTAGTGWSEERTADDPSTRNPAMAARTAAELRRLVSRGLAPPDIALITPYLAQARLLRAELDSLAAAGLEIDTIDAFQGREKEAVVVDLVRSNDDGDIGFLADTRRMNVALTRARRFLLVVGDSATLAGHPYYAAFLAAAEQTGLLLSAWSDEAPAF